MQLQASVGTPGTFSGLRLAGFSRLGGDLFTVGGQWSPAPQTQMGFQVVDARDVNTGGDNGSAPVKTTARSAFGAFAWANGDDHMQFNFIDSESNEGRHNLGAWFDGETRVGRYRQNFGVFRFERDMSWGYIPVNSDLLGGY